MVAGEGLAEVIRVDPKVGAVEFAKRIVEDNQILRSRLFEDAHGPGDSQSQAHGGPAAGLRHRATLWVF